MYRGYNIDLLVRDMVSADRELSGRLVGAPNKGVDFTDTKTGNRYEMTTPGQLQAHRRSYGSDFRLIDTSRQPLVDIGPGGGGGVPSLPPSFRGEVVAQ
jgi:hypothetical protein